MTARRSYGSVRKLPSGHWQARHRDAGGTLVAAPTPFRTKADADAWLKAAEVDQSRGTWSDPRRGRVALGVYAQGWLTERPLRPRTVELYEGLLRLHVLPELGAVDLGDLTPARVQAWRAALVKRSGPGSTVPAKAYRLLRTILGTATDDERIARNPCAIRGAGTEHAPERALVTVAQVAALADAVPDRYGPLVLLAATSGLRWGELIGLTRSRVDLAAGTVRVDRAMVETADGKVAPGPPKSSAGHRTVNVPTPVLTALDAHLAAFVAPDPEALLFAGEKGAPLRRRHFTYVWRRAVAEAGLPAGTHFHDLRHLAGTLAATTGATTRELMARLGHGSMRAAMIYQHAAADRDAVIARALDGLLGDALGGTPGSQPGTFVARRAERESVRDGG